MEVEIALPVAEEQDHFSTTKGPDEQVEDAVFVGVGGRSGRFSRGLNVEVLRTSEGAVAVIKEQRDGSTGAAGRGDVGVAPG